MENRIQRDKYHSEQASAKMLYLSVKLNFISMVLI